MGRRFQTEGENPGIGAVERKIPAGVDCERFLRESRPKQALRLQIGKVCCPSRTGLAVNLVPTLVLRSTSVQVPLKKELIGVIVGLLRGLTFATRQRTQDQEERADVKRNPELDGRTG